MMPNNVAQALAKGARVIRGKRKPRASDPPRTPRDPKTGRPRVIRAKPKK